MVNFKALPWQPVGSERRIISFRAAGYLCTYCMVALHQASGYHTRDQKGALSGLAYNQFIWRTEADAVSGTETDGQPCMGCGSDCTVHSVPDVETHGHFTVITTYTRPVPGD